MTAPFAATVDIVRGGLAGLSGRLMRQSHVAPPYRRGFVFGPFLLLMITGASVATAASLLAHRHLPDGALAGLPAIAFCAGMVLTRIRMTKTEIAAADVKGGASRFERADLDLEQGHVSPPAACGDCSPSEPSGDDAPVSHQATTAPGSSVARATAELSQYHVFTDILSRQMMSVTELSDDAATGILHGLTEMDGQIRGLLTYIQRSGSSDQATNVISQIESQMSGCRNLLDQFAARQRVEAQDGRDQRSKMMVETSQVLDVIDGVNNIARQTTMLSLNVSIEAARAGDAGKGFLIIAHEIRRLASEVQNLSVEVHARVKSLIGMITLDMKISAEQNEQAHRDSIANISATMTALTDSLVRLINHQREVIGRVETENESIARPLMDVMGRIQFQDIVRQQLEQLSSMAAMVDEHLSRVGQVLDDGHDDEKLPCLTQKIDELFDGYVMDRQREAHHSAQGRPNSREATALIELF